MERADVEYLRGDNGVPDNNTDPINGDIDTVFGPLDENTFNIIGQVPIPATGGGDQVYYGAAWKRIKTTATGTLESPSMYNRAGAILNTSAGVAQVVSTDAADTGDVVGTGKVSASWEQDTIEVDGTTPANGALTWDALSTRRWEYLEGGVPTVPQGNITISVAGQVVAVIWGQNTGRGNVMASGEFRFAPADAHDTTIGFSGSNNRVTAPDQNIESFDYYTRWPGGDNSIALAGGDMVADDTINYAVEYTAYEDIPAPAGPLVVDVDLVGEGVG